MPGWACCCPNAGRAVPSRATPSAARSTKWRGTASAPLPQAAWVVRLRSEFSRKQFVSATSDALKQAVRAELEQLLSRAQLPKPAVPAEARDVV